MQFIDSEDFVKEQKAELFVPTKEWLGVDLEKCLSNLLIYMNYFQHGIMPTLPEESFKYIDDENGDRYVKKDGIQYHMSTDRHGKINHIEIEAIDDPKRCIIMSSWSSYSTWTGYSTGLSISCGGSSIMYEGKNLSNIKLREADTIYRSDQTNYRFKLSIDNGIITEVTPMFCISLYSKIVGGLFEHRKGCEFVPSDMSETLKKFGMEHMI